MIKVIFSDIYRFFITKKVLLSVLLILVMCIMSIEHQLVYLPYDKDVDVIYYFNLILDIGGFQNMTLLLSSSVCSASFCDDWNNKNIHNLIIRSGKIKYSVSRFIVSGFTSFTCSFSGLLLFCFIISIFVPSFNEFSYETTLEAPYGAIITSVSPWMYVCIKSANISLSYAFWALFGLTLSSYYSNKLFAMASPFVGYYLISEFTENLPDFLNFRYIAYSYDILEKDISITLIYIVCFWLILSVLLLKLFISNMQKRMENEVD